MGCQTIPKRKSKDQVNFRDGRMTLEKTGNGAQSEAAKRVALVQIRASKDDMQERDHLETLSRKTRNVGHCWRQPLSRSHQAGWGSCTAHPIVSQPREMFVVGFDNCHVVQAVALVQARSVVALQLANHCCSPLSANPGYHI